jgi:hypothetical protein
VSVSTAKVVGPTDVVWKVRVGVPSLPLFTHRSSRTFLSQVPEEGDERGFGLRGHDAVVGQRDSLEGELKVLASRTVSPRQKIAKSSTRRARPRLGSGSGAIASSSV